MTMKRVAFAVLRATLGVAIGAGILFFLLHLVTLFLPVMGGGTRGKHVQEQKRFAAMFSSGDTNAPLLAMDWFNDHGVYFCRVSQSGKVSSARDVGHAIQGGSGISSRFALESTNRVALVETIDSLPPSSKASLPRERQILISGIRSNRWFKGVYDRANVPPQVERLYELTGAYLGWYIPLANGRQVAHSEYGGYATSQAGIDTFLVARDAPIAVSAGVNGIQVWDTKRGSVQDVFSLKILPIHQSFGNVAAISPDGGVLAVASDYGVYGVDLKQKKMLWQAEHLDRDNYYGKAIAIDGSGRYLFTAGAHIIERRDLLTGKKLGVLATNENIVHVLLTSQRGNILLAGCGNFNAPTVSFAVWEPGNDRPVYTFMEPQGARAGLSPDGKTIILSHFGQRAFVLLDWRNNRKEEVPLRVPYASSSAYSMYWSPDGKRLAAYIDTYPASIVVYDTGSWRPLAQWCCGQIMSTSKFAMRQDGVLLHLRDHDLTGLDVTALRGL